MKFKHLAVSLLIGALFAGTSHAQVKIGVVSSSTGPIAMVGIPQKNTVPLMPTKAGGQSIRYIPLDDGSDPTASVVAGALRRVAVWSEVKGESRAQPCSEDMSATQRLGAALPY